MGFAPLPILQDAIALSENIKGKKSKGKKFKMNRQLKQIRNLTDFETDFDDFF